MRVHPLLSLWDRGWGFFFFIKSCMVSPDKVIRSECKSCYFPTWDPHTLLVFIFSETGGSWSRVELVKFIIDLFLLYPTVCMYVCWIYRWISFSFLRDFLCSSKTSSLTEIVKVYVSDRKLFYLCSTSLLFFCSTIFGSPFRLISFSKYFLNPSL